MPENLFLAYLFPMNHSLRPLTAPARKLARGVRLPGFAKRRVNQSTLDYRYQQGERDFENARFASVKLGGCPDIDIRGADISRVIDLPLVLGTMNCTGCRIRGVNLAGADLTHAQLKNADLQGAILVGANLSGANCNRARLSDCNLAHANLNHVNMQYANLKRANLSEAVSIGGNFRHTLFAGANTYRFFVDGAQFIVTSSRSAPSLASFLKKLTPIQAAFVVGIVTITILVARLLLAAA